MTNISITTTNLNSEADIIKVNSIFKPRKIMSRYFKMIGMLKGEI